MAKCKHLSMGGPVKGCRACMAEGGEIKGVHEANYEGPGNSPAGTFSKAAVKGNTSIPKEQLNNFSKDEHRRVLGEMKADKQDRKYLADGGEVDGPADDKAIDDELLDMASEELLQAIESKDKKQILEAIRAIVLSCGDK